MFVATGGKSPKDARAFRYPIYKAGKNYSGFPSMTMCLFAKRLERGRGPDGSASELMHRNSCVGGGNSRSQRLNLCAIGSRANLCSLLRILPLPFFVCFNKNIIFFWVLSHFFQYAACNVIFDLIRNCTEMKFAH